jgi:hypothetical protein
MPTTLEAIEREALRPFDPVAGWRNVKARLPEGARRFEEGWSTRKSPSAVLGFGVYERPWPLFDHAYVYSALDGRRVWCAEPYGLWLEKDKLLSLSRLVDLGWTIDLSSHSRWWYGTVLLEMWHG